VFWVAFLHLAFGLDGILGSVLVLVADFMVSSMGYKYYVSPSILLASDSYGWGFQGRLPHGGEGYKACSYLKSSVPDAPVSLGTAARSTQEICSVCGLLQLRFSSVALHNYGQPQSLMATPTSQQ
jgi:hypothetical protein